MSTFNSLDLFLLAIFSLVLWLLLNFLISRLTGWGRIAAHYKSTEGIIRKVWRYQTISTRWGLGYKRSTNVGADSRGLYIFFGALFRFGHPPIFVPWGDITITEKEINKRNMLELRFRKTEDLPVRILSELGAHLAKAAGSNWPGREAHPGVSSRISHFRT